MGRKSAFLTALSRLLLPPQQVTVGRRGNTSDLAANNGHPDTSLPQVLGRLLRIRTSSKYLVPKERGTVIGIFDSSAHYRCRQCTAPQQDVPVIAYFIHLRRYPTHRRYLTKVPWYHNQSVHGAFQRIFATNTSHTAVPQTGTVCTRL